MGAFGPLCTRRGRGIGATLQNGGSKFTREHENSAASLQPSPNQKTKTKLKLQLRHESHINIQRHYRHSSSLLDIYTEGEEQQHYLVFIFQYD